MKIFCFQGGDTLCMELESENVQEKQLLEETGRSGPLCSEGRPEQAVVSFIDVNLKNYKDIRSLGIKEVPDNFMKFFERVEEYERSTLEDDQETDVKIEYFRRLLLR